MSRSERMHRSRLRVASIAVIASVALVLSGCSLLPGQATPKATPLVATIPATHQQVEVSAPTLSAPQLAGLESVGKLSAAVLGVPVQLSTKGSLPKSGAVLTRTYAAPLPKGATATFAYWNADLGAWLPVASTMSQDRRTVSATVHHFSFWDDFVVGADPAVSSFRAAVGKAGQKLGDFTAAFGRSVSAADAEVQKVVGEGADQLYELTGQLFSVRADAPKCSPPDPVWTKSVTYIQDDTSNPIRFCAGTNGGDLEVKAVANRGYAFPWSTAAKPDSITYSGDEQGFETALHAAAASDQDLANSFTQLTNHGQLILPGQTVTLDFPYSAAKGIKGYAPIVTVSEPNIPGFIAGWATAGLMKSGYALDESGVSAFIAVAACGDDVLHAKSWQVGSKALLDCADASTDVAVHAVEGGLLGAGVAKSAALSTAKDLLGKIAWFTVIFTAAQNVFDYTADRAEPSGARTVHFTLNPNYHPAPTVTAAQLQSIEAPAMCKRPAGKLVNGELPVADPDQNGETGLAGNPQGGQTFVATGVSPALPDGVVGVAFGCGAGGVGWPEVIGFYDQNLKLIGSQNLGDLDQQEHSDLSALTFSGGVFHATWTTNNYCHTGADTSVPRSADFTVGADGTVQVSNSVTGASTQPCDDSDADIMSSVLQQTCSSQFASVTNLIDELYGFTAAQRSEIGEHMETPGGSCAQAFSLFQNDVASLTSGLTAAAAADCPSVPVQTQALDKITDPGTISILQDDLTTGDCSQFQKDYQAILNGTFEG